MEAQQYYIIISILVLTIALVGILLTSLNNNKLRDIKNYERGLKLIPLLIHLPPPSDDIEVGGRDKRDVVEESISPALTLFSILSSLKSKDKKFKLYGQKSMSLELVASGGTINYYIMTPISVIPIVEQAITSAYPAARVEEVAMPNIFNPIGKSGGTIGGEIMLQRDFAFPIASYQETKKDIMQPILNSMLNLDKQDGVAIQILIRPANSKWIKISQNIANRKRKGQKDKGIFKGNLSSHVGEVIGALNKAPEWKGNSASSESKQISGTDQSVVEAIEAKNKQPGYETLIRVVASSNTAIKSQILLKNIVATFALANSEGRNGFRFEPAKDIDKFVTSYILRFFPYHQDQMILNTVELATIFHLPDQRNTPTSSLARQESKQVDGPSNIPTDGQLIGYNVYRGIRKEIRLTSSDRDRHMYIVGQTGTGKSYLMRSLIAQDMINGEGLCYIDPHGQDLTAIMGIVPHDRMEDVIYFSPAEYERPVGLNMLEYDRTHPEQRFFLIQECIAILYELYDPNRQGMMGARFETMFRNAALTVMADPVGGTLIDLPKLFVDQMYLNEKLTYVTDDTIREFWLKELPDSKRSNDSGEVIAWFNSKLGTFRLDETMRNIIGQIKSGINLREAMDSRKLIFINLSKGTTGELNTKLLGLIFVAKFTAAAMSRADIPNEEDRVPFNLYIDEFQNFMTESITTVLAEARKYKLRLVMANQYIGQLTDDIRDAVLGNVGSVIALRSSVNDAELLVKYFSPVFDQDDVTRMPNQNAAVKILVNGVPTQPFSMQTPPFNWKPNLELATKLKKLSGYKYGTSRVEVEADINERMKIRTIPIASPATSSPAAMIEKPKSLLESWKDKKAIQSSTNLQVEAPSPGLNMTQNNSPQNQTPMIQNPVQTNTVQ